MARASYVVSARAMARRAPPLAWFCAAAWPVFTPPLTKLAVPANITLLPLPPRSPELNPVENVWQFMRENRLSNRVFQSYEDIVALRCDAWNNLVERPWKIMSIGMRQWAHG